MWGPGSTGIDAACGFLSGGGEVARLIHARDWRRHPLGAPASWPDGLKASLGMVLASPEAMILAWGRDALSVFFNDAALPLFSPHASRTMGCRLDEVAADVWKQAGPIIEDAFAGRSTRHVSAPFAPAWNSAATGAWWTFAVSPIRDPHGMVAGLLIVASETTAQVTGARDMLESREQLQRAQEAGGVGVFAVGSDGVLHGSPELCRIYGFEPLGPVPATLFEALVIAEDAHLVSTLEKRASGAAPLDVRYRIRRADTGEVRWIERTGDLERDAAGGYRFVGVARDVTEQLRREEQLRGEREQLRQMFEQAPTFRALLRGPDHVIERANAGYIRLIGGRDVVGRTVAEALPDAVGQGHLERLNRVYRSGEAFSAENVLYVVSAAPGATPVEQYIDVVFQPLRDGDGTITGVFIEGVVVTERVRAQQAARARDQQFQTFAQAMPNHVWTAPPNGRIDWLNQRALDYSGRTLDRLTGDRWTEIVHPEDRTAAGALWTRSLRTGNQYETEFRIRRADGVYRWHLVRALPIHDERGRIVRWIGSNTDTHEQKLRQTESAADRDRLWSMSQELLLVHTSAGTITAVSPSAMRLLGWEQDEMVGRDVTEFLHPDDIDGVVTQYDASSPGGARQVFENRYRTRDGDYRLLAWTAVPDAGRIHAVGRDITAERQLARDRERVWNISPVLKVVSDSQGVIVDVNPSWTQTLGWSRAESIGRRSTEFMLDDEAAWARRVDALRAGESLQYRTLVRTRDGGERVIQWSTVPENDTFYGFGSDVTAEAEAAVALAETEAALRQAHKMEAVGQLTGGIAHDFNNLLQGITGSLEIVQRRVNEGRTADLERFVSGALTAANRAASLTHRLLAFSRRQPLDPKPVRANALVGSIEDLLRRTLGERIGLAFRLPTNLWVTRCDPKQLESAILNLVINARDAMADGGDLTIETRNVVTRSPAAHEHDVTPGEYVCVSVADTGVGMDAGTMAKAFDPFFTTKPIGQGTGLGLSMIYGFAQQSEGYVRIASTPGAGTTFLLYLPRYTGPLDAEDPAVPPPQPQAVDVGEVVLVVEDEAVVRGLIVEELAELGYAAIEAGDGDKALAVLESGRRIDLLVTDIGLPGLNGRQVADAARVLRPGLKVLFMTGYAEAAARSTGFLRPGMALITKPFTMQALASRVRAMIEGT